MEVFGQLGVAEDSRQVWTLNALILAKWPLKKFRAPCQVRCFAKGIRDIIVPSQFASGYSCGEATLLSQLISPSKGVTS